MSKELLAIEERLQNIEQLLLSQKTVFTFDEAAQYTGLSKSYLYKHTCSGIIPHFKPNGKKIYFERQSLDAWLLRNEVKPANEIETQANTYVTMKGGRK